MHLSMINDYISGNEFSNSLRIRSSKMEKSIPGRMETIEKIVKGKDVVHFGCADHLEIIEAKITKNIWFHKRLMGSARRCVGIDNNRRAVEFLQGKLNIPDIYYTAVQNKLEQ